MILVVFRSRLSAKLTDYESAEYKILDARMDKLIVKIPGYISHKSFKSIDDEEVVIAEFETEEALRRWSSHPDHVSAKRKGNEIYLAEYRIQVCSVLRDTTDHK
ncbi:antibiotic biosynthesis monooxygenase family protein [Pseudomonas aeruginosa]|uniref:antibiotic biosynthesis monooxygenase family protein n=1 Tax=Pseudomonas aeruginosa TaxID=287 RepID=UPI000BB58579|nr:antibiotic biosynthesis monooxygenase [Pseudomonas aeruginosa]PBM99991.1 hypothetical protein B8A54_20015 [Pseudomonas aeruginosa]